MIEPTHAHVEGKRELLRSLLDHHFNQGQNVLSGGTRVPYPHREELGEWKRGVLPDSTKGILKEFLKVNSNGFRETRGAIERIERGHKNEDLTTDEAVDELHNAFRRFSEMHAEPYTMLSQGLLDSLSDESNYNIFDDAFSAISNAANAVGEAATSVAQSVQDFFDTIPGQLAQAGIDAWNTSREAFESWADTAKLGMTPSQLAQFEEMLYELELDEEEAA
jgi:hypothetical protein